MPKQLSLITGTPGSSANIEASGADDNKTHRVKMEVYTGAPFRPRGWYADHPLVLDISGMQKPPGGQAPFHRDHDMSKVVGHAERITGKTSIMMEGPLSGSNQFAQEVLDSSQKGFPWKASLGASLLKSPDFIAEGSSAVVNGRRVTGPVFVARRWALLEGSFVSIGADPNTSAIAAGGNSDMFREWLIQAGVNPDDLNAEQLTSLQAAYDAMQKKPEPVKVEASAEPVKATGVNADQVAEIVAKTIQAQREKEAKLLEALGDHKELLTAAVAGGWDVDRCKNEAELVDLRAERSHGPFIHVRGGDAPEVRGRQIEAAMLRASGHWSDKALVATFGEKVVEGSEKIPKAVGLKYLVHEFLRANGQYVHAGVFDDDTIRAAMRLDQRLLASGSGFSTLSMSGTLSNLANKTLQRAFQETPSIFRRFCRTVPHSDFKIHTKYRVSHLGDLEKISATGEIPHTERSEASYTNQVETYGRMMALTRQMMRNDDLGAFLDIPLEFGSSSARTLEKSVFTKLLDNTDLFFDSAPSAPLKANALASGAGSALSPTSLGSAETLFWSQEDELGNPVSFTPSLLLTAPAKHRDAVNITTKTTVVAAGNVVSGEEVRISNEYVGEFEAVRSPWIASTAISGASSNKWFLLSAPTGPHALMEVAFLDGRQTPTIDSADTDFNTLGYQWRVVYDWGVAKSERRCGVYSPGA